MRVAFRHIFRIGRWLLVGGAFLLAALVRDQPWQPSVAGGLVHIDALSAFFVILTFAGHTIITSEHRQSIVGALQGISLLIAYMTTSIPLICVSYLVFVALGTVSAARPQRRIRFTLDLLPSILLAAGWIRMVFTHGLWRYDAADGGDALGSWSFGLILVATLLGSQPLLRDALPGWITEGVATLQRRALMQAPTTDQSYHWGAVDVWALAWLYPLLRLYSLGPWNAGWSFATLLLGCAIALWCAARASAMDVTLPRQRAICGSLLGMALACAGLSSAAGVAACCLALICALLLGAGLSEGRQLPGWLETANFWLLSGALPITLPFVAIWLGMGAAAAGGVLLATGAFWLVGLGNALAVLRLLATRHAPQPVADADQPISRWSLVERRSLAAVASLVLGGSAPAIVQWPILPVARQIQGGLSPYGDIAVWPWIGLAAVDSGRQQVAILPSGAVAGLMLVLCALAWLLSRIFSGDHSR